MTLLKRISFILFAGYAFLSAKETRLEDYYEIENIDLPEGESSADGISFLPDGRLAVCLSLSKVYIYDPSDESWSLFAEGLQTPLGIYAVSESEMIVCQRPEVTRILDTDGDGKADYYQSLTDQFGLSGTYGDWNFGPVKDEEGNLFFSLGSGSQYGKIYLDEVRGEYSPAGHWGRMNSLTPYRGWVMRLSPDGELTPWASGMREPNGLGFDLEGRLFVPDNQGDWVGSSPLYHVERDKFYGWVPALTWDEDIDEFPIDIPVDRLDEMRTPPAIVFPHGDMANSVTQPICDTTEGKFGPFAGQMFIGEMNHNYLIRLSMEEVDGALQGAAIPFFRSDSLNLGGNRLAFNPKDGSLWIGQTKHASWVGDSGLQKISYKGKLPMEVKSISLTDTGFRFEFTQRINFATAKDVSSYGVSSYYYNYDGHYGSEKHGVKEVAVESVTISKDKRSLEVRLPLEAWRLYDFKLPAIVSKSGHELLNRNVVYTLNRLRDGTPDRPKPLPMTKPVYPHPKKQLVSGSEPRSVGGPQNVSRVPRPGLDVRVEKGAVTVHENGQPVIRYNRDPVSRSDGTYTRAHYIHPLYAPDGTVMTDDMPKDHPHHRGIFWGWTQLVVDGEAIGDPWHLRGLSRHVEDVDVEVCENAARLACDVVWHTDLLDTESGGRDLVKEHAIITVNRMRGSTRRIDFEIQLQALQENVQIGGSRNTKGYGGFSVRIPLPEDLSFAGPSAEPEVDWTAPAVANPWVDFSASFVEGKRSGVSIFTHPANPGYPHGWTLRKANSCQNPVFPGQTPITLPVGQPLVLRYSVYVHDAPYSFESVGAAYHSYVEETRDVSDSGRVARRIFPFDNAFSKEDSLESQMSLIKGLGYSGIGSRPKNATPELFAALKKRKLKMETSYVTIRVENEGTEVPAEVVQHLVDLKGHDTIVWLSLTGKDVSDEVAMDMIEQVHDLCLESELELVLYPHDNFVTDTVATCTRLADKIGRNSIGISFNLCHFLAQNDRSKLEDTLRSMGSRLKLVQLSGSDDQKTNGPGWSDLIKPLGEGNFDMRKFLDLLDEVGYEGPINLQCYGLETEAHDHLSRSIDSWLLLNK
ncbi:DUF6807 family protein [Pelagicoccus mobilis]|uniref:PmoA family protein n=1 Tax=Pelagicoccus mobilis TaxID=415221 RepID=A0A934RVH2_9BACT|nr:DUF6807 family protein [Pelagicoccus mobilis]MBK1875909.1 PmoA family protein [Pelagicoccus mobilis]